MQEKDAHRQMDELLRQKTYDQLDAKERALVSELGYTAAEYDFLYQSKAAFQTEETEAAETELPASLRSAVRANRHRSPLSYRLSAWQVAAALLLWFGIQQFELPKAKEEPVMVTYSICPADTLQKVWQDTLRLFMPASRSAVEAGDLDEHRAVAYDSLGRYETPSPDAMRRTGREDWKRFFTKVF